MNVFGMMDRQAEGAMARILIIDDEPDVTRPLAEWLRMHKHDVLIAHSAEDGFRQAEQQRPDLIMLDLCLPDQSGLRLGRRLQTSTAAASVPIVMLSALTKEYREQGEQLGIKAFLSKPYDLRQVLDTVSALLAARSTERAGNDTAA